MGERVGVREYARRRGVSQKAVQKAISSGRLERSITRTPGKGWPKIDVEVADLEWAENTDPAQARAQPTQDEGRQTAFVDDTPEPGDPEGNGHAGPSMARANAVKVSYQAQLLRLRYEQESGALCKADTVRVEAFTMARQLRDTLLLIPDRVVAPHAVKEAVRAEIHKALEDFVAASRRT